MYHNIFDTHSHYDDESFNPDREALINSLQGQGVSYIVSCGCDLSSTKLNLELAEKYDFFYFTAGFHPENIEMASDEALEEIKKFAMHEKCVAIGEIGLDYHWTKETKDKQIEFFKKQIELAKELDLPIVVHDREAHGDTLEILKEYQPKGVLHCFSGSKEMAREIINLGMYIGFNGVATFKNARKSLEVAKEIPIERIVLETDCPYLAPEPHRGKRNNSSYIPFVAKRIGELLEIDAQELLSITNENAKRLYNL